MAIGDDAVAAGMAIVPGSTLANTIHTEINQTRDYIAQRTSAVQPIAKGGTGATTAGAALAALGGLPRSEVFDGTGSVFDKVPRYDSSGRLICAAPAASNHAVPYGTLAASVANYLPLWGGTVTGDVLLPNTTPATSGWTIAYIDGNGRISKGASSERYKEDVHTIDPGSLGDIWPALHSYRMVGGDGSERYGWIAERLAENPDLAPFVVYAGITGETLPDSIDFIGLLIAQNAQLHQALDILTQRIERLEGRA